MKMLVALCVMVVVVVVVAVAAVGVGGAQAQGLAAGDMAPAFTLPGSDGKTHSLSDYAGRTVVLAWFPKAFTGG